MGFPTAVLETPAHQRPEGWRGSIASPDDADPARSFQDIPERCASPPWKRCRGGDQCRAAPRGHFRPATYRGNTRKRHEASHRHLAVLEAGPFREDPVVEGALRVIGILRPEGCPRIYGRQFGSLVDAPLCRVVRFAAVSLGLVHG